MEEPLQRSLPASARCLRQPIPPFRLSRPSYQALPDPFAPFAATALRRAVPAVRHPPSHETSVAEEALAEEVRTAAAEAVVDIAAVADTVAVVAG